MNIIFVVKLHATCHYCPYSCLSKDLVFCLIHVNAAIWDLEPTTSNSDFFWQLPTHHMTGCRFFIDLVCLYHNFFFFNTKFCIYTCVFLFNKYLYHIFVSILLLHLQWIHISFKKSLLHRIHTLTRHFAEKSPLTAVTWQTVHRTRQASEKRTWSLWRPTAHLW